MSKIERTIEFVKELAANFGAKNGDLVSDYTFRNNTKEDALNQGGAFFGLISLDEEVSGPYHDFSLVIFPDKENNPWLISLVVGTLGFKNDYELATLPGVRRLFSSIVSENGFCKTSFLDIESNLLKQIKLKAPNLDKSLQNYSKLISAYEIILDPETDDGRKVIAGFIAAYAQLRNFPRNSAQRKAVSKAIAAVSKIEDVNEENEVLKLVQKRKFVVLQGGDVSYIEQKGIFYESLKRAKENPGINVVLLIDEINRANLSNILGPIFYLFEYQLEDREELVEIDIGGGYRVSNIPSNYYVICTMNTADRSLAVVDFALRRRFAWYTLKPKEIEVTGRNKFFRDDFREFSRIFNLYSKSEELSLQPGQAYFIAETDEEMKNRVRYELLPLIREYLAEGVLTNSKDEFSKYFYDRVGEVLFE